LAPGIYDLEVSATGYGTTVLIGNTVMVNGTATVNVSLGSAGAVSGTVTQSDGVTPISGATVTALEGGDTAGSASTNASGAYTISALGAGSYLVQAAASGYTTQNRSGVPVTAGNTATANFSLAGQSVIAYQYDELGRLVGVTDSLNGSATYTYDAVGNILSISRSVPSPKTTGASGALDRTASQSGSLKAGNALARRAVQGQTPGQVQSSAQTASRAPTITGFSPMIANVGDAVTITGSNFDVPVNDKVRINNGLATVTSATATRIATSVPAGASSGRISLATPMGRTISAANLFVLPAGYVPGSVAFTGRISLGGAFTGSLEGSQIGLVVFDGVAGQNIALRASGAALAGARIVIQKPNGALLAEVDVGKNGVGVANAILPVTGTYTVMVAKNGGSAGSLTLRLAANAAGAGAQ
jgi:YD repeat-containing protein